MDPSTPETPEVLQPPTMGMEFDAIPDDPATEPEEPEEEEECNKEPTLYHFLCRYDQNWNYPEICKKFFMEEKEWLCVKEHQNLPNTHVHFQGYSMLTKESFKKKMTRLAHTHHIKKENPKSRPVSMHGRDTTELGFQYMMKEQQLRQPLAHNLFTTEKLKELKERSVLHCQKIKTLVKDAVISIPESTMLAWIEKGYDANTLVKLAARYLFAAQEAGKLDLPEYNPRHSRTSIIRGLIAHPKITRNLKADLYFS